MKRALATALLVGGLLAGSAPMALAQDRVEVGTSLISGIVSLGGGDDDFALGIPSASLGFVSPCVYASVFSGPNLAFEPQVGFLVTSSSGELELRLHLAGQVDYFLRPNSGPAPFVFVAGGVLDTSDAGYTPKCVAAGAGYRRPLGGRLTTRLDARYTHFSGGGGSVLSFNLSLGGLLGRR